MKLGCWCKKFHVYAFQKGYFPWLRKLHKGSFPALPATNVLLFVSIQRRLWCELSFSAVITIGGRRGRGTRSRHWLLSPAHAGRWAWLLINRWQRKLGPWTWADHYITQCAGEIKYLQRVWRIVDTGHSWQRGASLRDGFYTEHWGNEIVSRQCCSSVVYCDNAQNIMFKNVFNNWIMIPNFGFIWFQIFKKQEINYSTHKNILQF